MRMFENGFQSCHSLMVLDGFHQDEGTIGQDHFAALPLLGHLFTI